MWQPKRQCLSCRTKKEKRELIRIARSPGGEIAVGEKAAGRGTYVCKSDACLTKLAQKRLLSRAFHTDVPDSVYDDLRKEASV